MDLDDPAAVYENIRQVKETAITLGDILKGPQVPK